MSSESICNEVDNVLFDTPEDLIDPEVESSCVSWPKLSQEALCGLPGDIVDLATRENEVDPVAVLLTILTWFCASVGISPHIQIGDTKHPPRIFSVLVGATSRARKGTSEHPVRRIFEKAQELLQLPILKVTPGPLSSGEGLINALRDPQIDSKNRIFDEGILDKRLLCIESEFASVFKMSKREGNNLSCILRTAWDHGNIEPLTKYNKISTTNAHICIIGHITHEELMSSIGNNDISNGFGNRILWGCVRRPKKVPFPKPMPEFEVNSISEKLGKAILFAKNAGCLELDSKARDLWETEYEKLSYDTPGRLGAVTSRAEAQTLRLALIFALLDASESIKDIHLRSAIALWQFCFDSAEFLFGGVGSYSKEEKIIELLKTGERTTTELHDLFKGHLKGKTLKELLNSLQLRGIIDFKKTGGGQGKGKGARSWFLL